MTTPQYIDIYQGNSMSDWQAYKKWSAQFDGISRVAIKVTEGTGGIQDRKHIDAAQQAGIEQIIWYHFARPDLNPGWQGAQNEVNFFREHLPTLRSQDYVMLDYEGFPGVPDAPWKADWAWDWLHLMAGNAGIATSRVALYSYESFIVRLLQYEPLAQFPLILARYNASKSDSPLPPVPTPWKSMLAWQFSDHQQVPGAVGYVDCDLWFASTPSPVPPPFQPDIQGAIVDITSALKKLTGK